MNQEMSAVRWAASGTEMAPWAKTPAWAAGLCIGLLAAASAARAQPGAIPLPDLRGNDWVVQDRVTCESRARVTTRREGEAADRDPVEEVAPWTLATELSREVHLAPGQAGDGGAAAGVHYRRARVTSAVDGALEPMPIEGMTLAFAPDARGMSTAGLGASERALVERDRMADLLALGGVSIGQHVGTTWVFTPSEWRALGGDYLAAADRMKCEEAARRDGELTMLCKGTAAEPGGAQEIRVRLTLQGPDPAVAMATWESTTTRQVVRPAPTPNEEIVTVESKTCSVEVTQAPQGR